MHGSSVHDHSEIGKHPIKMLLLIVAAVAAASDVPPTDDENSTPVLSKCCPEGLFLHLESFSCVSRILSTITDDSQGTGGGGRKAENPFSSPLPIEPAFSSEFIYYESLAEGGGGGGDEEDAAKPDLPDFRLHHGGGGALPFSHPPPISCDPSSEDPSALVKWDNDVRQSHYGGYIVDDMNVTGNHFALVDLRDKRQYSSFCVEATPEGTAAAFCRERPDAACAKKKRPCLSFCFRPGEYYDSETEEVLPVPQEAGKRVIPFVEEDGVTKGSAADDLKFLYETPPRSCGGANMVHYDQFAVFGSSGRVAVEGDLGGALKYDEYCLARYGKLEEVNATNRDDEFSLALRVFVCPVVQDPFVAAMNLQVVPALCSVSLLFLAALFAFLAYVKPRRRAREQLRRRQQHQQQQQQQQQQQPVMRPQKLRVSVGLFECMTLSLVATLFFLYVFLIVGKAAQRRLMEGFMTGCIANGLLVQYCYLSAIFWLHAMNFHVWRGLRSMRPDPDAHLGGASSSGGRHGWKTKRFKRYAAYAWSGPTIIIAITFLMQALPPGTVPDAYRPGLGSTSCFLSEVWPAKFLYMNVAVLPIALSNAAFFLSSTFNLCWGLWAADGPQQQQQGQQLRGTPSAVSSFSRRRHRAKYATVVKMFFAMGLPWTAELASYLVTAAYGPAKFKYLIAAFSVVNSLQGLIMFCLHAVDLDSLGRCCCKGGGKGEGSEEGRRFSSTGGNSSAAVTGLQTGGENSMASSGSLVWRRLSSALSRTFSGTSQQTQTSLALAQSLSQQQLRGNHSMAAARTMSMPPQTQINGDARRHETNISSNGGCVRRGQEAERKKSLY